MFGLVLEFIMETITAMPFDSVSRAGRNYRSVVLSVRDESGRTFSRVYFNGRECEDYINAKPVPRTNGLLPETLFANSWSWIEEKAKRFLQTGNVLDKQELMGKARWL